MAIYKYLVARLPVRDLARLGAVAASLAPAALVQGRVVIGSRELHVALHWQLLSIRGSRTRNAAHYTWELRERKHLLMLLPAAAAAAVTGCQ